MHKDTCLDKNRSMYLAWDEGALMPEEIEFGANADYISVPKPKKQGEAGAIFTLPARNRP